MNAFHLAALPPALLLIAEPTLWPWALAVAAFVVIAAALTAAHRFRNERDEARENEARAERRAEVFADEIGERDREIAELDAECQRLHNELTEAQIAAGVVIPFPTQRTGAHDDLAALDAEATAYTWPAIARDAFPIQQWGEDAER